LVLSALLPASEQAAAAHTQPPSATATQHTTLTTRHTPFTPIEAPMLHAGMKAHNAARKDRDRDSDSRTSQPYRSNRGGLSAGGSDKVENPAAERRMDTHCRILRDRLNANTQQARRATTIHSRDRVEDERRAIRRSLSNGECSHF
jgi:hypothetical protein